MQIVRGESEDTMRRAAINGTLEDSETGLRYVRSLWRACVVCVCFCVCVCACVYVCACVRACLCVRPRTVEKTRHHLRTVVFFFTVFHEFWTVVVHGSYAYRGP